MNKIINFFKKLFCKFKNEIVMEQPEPKTKRKGYKKEQENSKQTKVKKHLLEKGSIDRKIAKELYGTKRLPAIINRLRNKGYNIISVKTGKNFTTYTYFK
jgi:hypothetical protein